MAHSKLTPPEIEGILEASKASNVTRRGGNSTVSRVEWANDVFAVKDFSARSDGLLRLKRECEALRFLNDSGMPNFPQLFGASTRHQGLVMSWINGEKPALSEQLICQMTEILASLHTLSKSDVSQRVGLAADSITEIQDVREQVAHRIALLQQSPHREVRNFLKDHLVPVVAELEVEETGGAVMTLSPSEYGPHNILVAEDATHCTVIDLEFFGWDDAHKLVGDVLLHPQIDWPENLRIFLIDRLTDQYALSHKRLQALMPWLSMKWALIVLARNERELTSQKELDTKLSHAAHYLRPVMDF